MKKYVLIIVFFAVNFSAICQVPSYLKDYKEEFEKNPREANLHWFRDARFGMFIHYGLYSQLGLFLYYSYAADWKHPYFYSREDGWKNGRPAYPVRPKEYKYKKPEDFRKYVDYVHAQLKELITQYPTIAGIWFDPIVGFYANPNVFPIDETYSLIRTLSPHALISFKQGANGNEDFVAPERGGSARVGEEFSIAQKIYEQNKNKPKEICNTMQPHLPGIQGGATWGYNKAIDGHHLKVEDVEKLLNDAKLMQYNLLLNIGPLPDGSIHPEDLETLSNLYDSE